MHIIEFAKEVDSLLSLSSVNQIFRQLCAPHVFHSLKVAFSTIGLDNLLEISQSQVAQHVRTVLYEVPERIDPLIENWDYFQSNIYTPSEYERDQREAFWTFGGQEVSYSTVFTYFSSQARDQRIVQQKAQDIEALITSIPRFPKLEAIYMRFTDGIQAPFRWFAGRVFLDNTHTLTDHLVKMAAAITVARLDGVSIRTFEVSGFYSRIDLADPLLLDLMRDALNDVHELRAINSPTMLEFLSLIPLPSLQRFELASCWLSIENLEDFVRKHAGSLRYLHLEDTWLLHEKINEDGIYLSMANAQSILDNLTRIWDAGILDEVTINRRPGGFYEAQVGSCN
ncbi:uncharacterized protein ATNIH1004_011305 [Aspergillus tanneri]|uniref:F-box domain-containing protein n=1 Tax=Aspergillus tanneri TaxID=1220188 RepID=A0A5M9M6I6_9EURO|nr:uncharacterized protein ATNIH1004_011305 [Aspergillus tanneri]KAA8642361.1 hypothetical protein ATNIH1004_011305 [Aspergillus tanneri]